MKWKNEERFKLMKQRDEADNVDLECPT